MIIITVCQNLEMIFFYIHNKNKYIYIYIRSRIIKSRQKLKSPITMNVITANIFVIRTYICDGKNRVLPVKFFQLVGWNGGIEWLIINGRNLSIFNVWGIDKASFFFSFLFSSWKRKFLLLRQRSKTQLNF